MAIYKRGNIWWIRYTEPDGRTIRESAQTADRRQAQEYHDRRKAEGWRLAKLGERPRHGWREAVVRWSDEHKDRKSMANVLTAFKQADPILGGLCLDQITRDVLAGLARRMQAAGLQNSTINSRMSAIKAVLRAASEWGWLDSTPAWRRLPVTDRRVRWLTRDEAARLIAELPPHLAAMARFSLATGLREKNVCRLEWRQVDLERRIAWIHADQAKAKRVIAVPLNAEAVIVLREQIGKHPERVFTRAGKPLESSGWTAWKSALKRAGIENFRWHDLRHTWASWHIQAGTPVSVLKELGGWASLDMVMVYAHLAPEHLAEHAERIAIPRLVGAKRETKEIGTKTAQSR